MENGPAWVIIRGLPLAQPAPRYNTSLMADKFPQPSHASQRQAPVTLARSDKNSKNNKTNYITCLRGGNTNQHTLHASMISLCHATMSNTRHATT